LGMNFDAESLIELLLVLPALLLSLTLHEYAHARTALAFGDPTAKLMGRVSLNPLHHLDPIGTIVLIVTRFIGWAKPVPVNPANLRPRRLGQVAVSLAGPLTNLALGIAAGIAIRLLLAIFAGSDSPLIRIVYLMLFVTLSLNLMLFLFNLIPLWPLDGHHVLRELLPVARQGRYMFWQVRYGQMILLAIIIGPPLLGAMMQRDVVGPVGLVYDHVIGLAIRTFGISGVIRYVLH